MDEYTLKNMLAAKFTKKIINSRGMHAGKLDNLVVEIGMAALTLAKSERENRRVNISETEVSIDDVFDDEGRRRYRLACVDDEPHMQPDEEGLWVILRFIQKLIYAIPSPYYKR